MAPMPTTNLASTQTRDWITALVVGVTTTMLAACGVIIAYRQFRRGQKMADPESSDVDAISLQGTAEVAPAAQGSYVQMSQFLSRRMV